MKTLLKNVALIALIVIPFSCSTISKLDSSEERFNDETPPIVGTWEKITTQDADSVGNILTDVEKFELSGLGSNDRTKTLEWLNLTSSGEGFSLYDSVRIGLGFTYEISDSIFVLGNRKYKVIAFKENVLQIMEFPDELMSLTGTYALTTWKRINKYQIKSTRLELLDLIQGEWSLGSLQNVKTTQAAMFNERAIITDTIGQEQKMDVYLRFDESRFELGKYSTGVAGVFDYSLADSVISVEDLPFYSILKIGKDSLSLLGPLLAEEQGQIVGVWKMKRVKKQ